MQGSPIHANKISSAQRIKDGLPGGRNAVEKRDIKKAKKLVTYLHFDLEIEKKGRCRRDGARIETKPKWRETRQQRRRDRVRGAFLLFRRSRISGRQTDLHVSWALDVDGSTVSPTHSRMCSWHLYYADCVLGPVLYYPMLRSARYVLKGYSS